MCLCSGVELSVHAEKEGMFTEVRLEVLIVTGFVRGNLVFCFGEIKLSYVVFLLSISCPDRYTFYPLVRRLTKSTIQFKVLNFF